MELQSFFLSCRHSELEDTFIKQCGLLMESYTIGLLVNLVRVDDYRGNEKIERCRLLMNIRKCCDLIVVDKLYVRFCSLLEHLNAIDI